MSQMFVRPQKLTTTFEVGISGFMDENLGVEYKIFKNAEKKYSSAIVYILVLADGSKIIKVGETGDSLTGRWVTVFHWWDAKHPLNLKREHEIKAVKAAQEELRGQHFVFWLKEWETHQFIYEGQISQKVSLRHLEEMYLDWLLEPRVGRHLGLRKQR
jgi:hypothetical protein